MTLDWGTILVAVASGLISGLISAVSTHVNVAWLIRRTDNHENRIERLENKNAR